MDDISDKKIIEYAIENAEEGTVFGITDFKYGFLRLRQKGSATAG